MEEKDLEFDEFLKDQMSDYIALHFRGQHYNPVIRFTEVLLEKLKEEAEISIDKRIKGISER